MATFQTFMRIGCESLPEKRLYALHDVSITYPSHMAIDGDRRAGMGWSDGLKEERRERVIY